MKEILLVVGCVCVAHGIVWCRNSTWHATEPDHAGEVAEYNRNYKVEMTSEGAIVLPRYMVAEE